jgi:hypothetical protein
MSGPGATAVSRNILCGGGGPHARPAAGIEKRASNGITGRAPVDDPTVDVQDEENHPRDYGQRHCNAGYLRQTARQPRSDCGDGTR